MHLPASNSGRGGMTKKDGTNRVLEAKIRRTVSFFTDRENFMVQLVREVENGVKYAEKRGYVPCFRLNLTSDIPWEKYPVLRNGKEYRNIMSAFPSVQFYDYTAMLNRKVGDLDNYHLTFSCKEDNFRKLFPRQWGTGV